MPRYLLGFVLTCGFVLTAVPVRAHDAYDDSQSHPLRIAAYAMNPAGFAVEWLVTRPLHFVASHPRLERVFGHGPHENPFGSYEPYQPDSR